MYGNLSLQQSPPFSVPARFLLTAPFFGVSAALILLVAGPDLLASRWSPGMFAAIHALVLGFFTTIMLGALQQILPVVAGVNISQAKRLATFIYLFWVPGIVLLVAAFWSAAALPFYTAVLMLGCAIIIFATAIILSVARAATGNESVPGIKLAVIALVVALLSGAILVFGHTGAIPLRRPELTNLHLSWGLVGWIGILVMSIAWQVVPMFQITPPYPAWLRKSAVPFFLTLLLIKTSLLLIDNRIEISAVKLLVDILLAIGLSTFAVVTLQLQLKTRRKVKDNHRYFWRLSMVELLIAVVLWVVATISNNPLFGLLAGVLFLFGFAMMVVTGMLLKIVAFLIWLHLQQARDQLVKLGRAAIKVPKMNAIISSRTGARLLIVLIAAQSAMILAILFPPLLSIIAALSWLVFFSFLGGVLAEAMLRYRHIAAQAAFAMATE